MSKDKIIGEEEFKDLRGQDIRRIMYMTIWNYWELWQTVYWKRYNQELNLLEMKRSNTVNDYSKERVVGGILERNEESQIAKRVKEDTSITSRLCGSRVWMSEGL